MELLLTLAFGLSAFGTYHTATWIGNLKQIQADCKTQNQSSIPGCGRRDD